VKFSVCPSILLNNKECSPLGVNEGENFTHRGQISPLGAKFTHRGEVHPWGPGMKLRMALRVTRGVCKNVTQNVAQSINCKNNYITFAMEK
jgi:hypothetical protein